jgi:hypothetical protein
MSKNSDATSLRSTPFRPPLAGVPPAAPEAGGRPTHPPGVPSISVQLAAAAATEARLRRWLFYLAFCIAWMFVALIILGTVTTRFLFPRGEQPAAGAADNPAPAQSVASPALPAPAPPVRSPAPNEAPPETLDSLVGVHLYQSYLNIGVLADATEGDVYTPAEANKLLDRVTAVMDTVDRQLTRLEEAGKIRDAKSLERTRRLAVLLRTQAKELRQYWATDGEEHAKRYHSARAEAWAGITELLGIKE